MSRKIVLFISLIAIGVVMLMFVDGSTSADTAAKAPNSTSKPFVVQNSTTTPETTSAPTTTTTLEAPAKVELAPVPTTSVAPRVTQPPVQRQTPAYNGSSTGSVNGYPCGGDLPPCYILKRESGGSPTAQNPTSTASGLWQFLDSTWAGFGGYFSAKYAPASVQNAKARQLWAGGAGCAHWLAC